MPSIAWQNFIRKTARGNEPMRAISSASLLYILDALKCPSSYADPIMQHPCFRRVQNLADSYYF